MPIILAAIEAIEDEDARALVGRLFNSYARQVKALARQILQNEQDAEDALHDTFLKIIRYREKFMQLDEDETRRLLVIYTRSVCFNLYRRKKRAVAHTAEAEDAPSDRTEAEDVAAADALARVLMRERADRLAAAIDTLSSPAREIILLKYYGDLSNREIADLLGIGASTVGSSLQRSLKKIKEKTEAYFRGQES